MKVLVIDNHVDRDSWGAAQICQQAALEPRAQFYVRRAIEKDLPKDLTRFDGIIVSGSRTSCRESADWIDSLLELIRNAVAQGKPFLGICFGHQMLIRALGGPQHLRLADQAEVGWIQVEQTSQSRLFDGLPKQFSTFALHVEEAKALPPGMRALARSEACPIQACQVGHLPVYGIQFHPEKNLPAALAILKQRKIKSSGPPPYDPQVGNRIFQNFLSGNL